MRKLARIWHKRKGTGCGLGRGGGLLWLHTALSSGWHCEADGELTMVAVEGTKPTGRRGASSCRLRGPALDAGVPWCEGVVGDRHKKKGTEHGLGRSGRMP